VSFSLNEIEALSLKAARGAGYDWGLAQDAGKSAAWLWAHRLDGSSAFAAWLKSGFALNLKRHMPTEYTNPLRAEGMICPFVLGACLSDRSANLVGETMAAQSVAFPLLVVPMVSAMARRLECSIEIECDGRSFAVDQNGATLDFDLPDVADQILIRTSETPLADRPKLHRADPSKDSLSVLLDFAHRTYAPATEESRRLGAGSGGSDND